MLSSNRNDKTPLSVNTAACQRRQLKRMLSGRPWFQSIIDNSPSFPEISARSPFKLTLWLIFGDPPGVDKADVDPVES